MPLNDTVNEAIIDIDVEEMFRNAKPSDFLQRVHEAILKDANQPNYNTQNTDYSILANQIPGYEKY